MNNLVKIYNDLFSWQFVGEGVGNMFNTWLIEVENIEYKTTKHYQLNDFLYRY